MSLNIFSKKRKSKKEKLEITADCREKNSLVIAELRKRKIQVNIEHLKVADYIIKNTAVERKTSHDFLKSMINKRLFRQLKEIKQYPQPLLIIEGNLESTEMNVHKNAVKGFLLSILLNYKVPIIFTKSEEDTAKYLITLIKQKIKTKNEKPIRARKKLKNEKEQLQYILEGFPNIGPVTAKKLLRKYKTIQNIINAQINDLKNLIGKKASIFKLARKKF